MIRLAAALLLLPCAACSGMSGIPIVGAFAPSPGADMMRQAQANQQNAMLNYTFRPGWKNLIDDHKYKAALAYIDAHKEEIGETNEKTFIEDTQRECRNYVASVSARFRRSIQDLKSQKELAAMKSEEFAGAFQVPPPDELVSTSPVYEWARTYAVGFEDFRTRKPSGESLLKATSASAALPADDDGENRWFETMEALVYRSFGDAIRSDVERSQDAPKADREEAQSRTEGLLKQWSGFVDGLPAGSRQRTQAAEHGTQLAKLREGYPKDLPELATIDVSAILAGNNPEGDLQKAERTLKNLDGRSGVSRESRQRLYSLIITVVSLRSFLQGREEGDVVADLKAYADPLKKLGGATDARAYGARVQSVFDTLLR